MPYCLPALFYVNCRYTAEHSVTRIISSNVKLCPMTFCCCTSKLQSKVPSVKGSPIKIHSSIDHSKQLFRM